MNDPYRVLGVTPDATQEEITGAYHRLVRQYHPDRAEDGADRFREVVAAYDALRAEEPPPRRVAVTGPAIRVGPVRYHGPPRRT